MAGMNNPAATTPQPSSKFRDDLLAGAGLPGWLVERLVELNIMMADGHAAGVTDEVARLIGRQPRTFAQFAADHRAAFGGQQ
jgi:prepilin-type processing-associated H-X9-DG protein